jgi:hypothetical protein
VIIAKRRRESCVDASLVSLVSLVAVAADAALNMITRFGQQNSTGIINHAHNLHYRPLNTNYRAIYCVAQSAWHRGTG